MLDFRWRHLSYVEEYVLHPLLTAVYPLLTVVNPLLLTIQAAGVVRSFADLHEHFDRETLTSVCAAIRDWEALDRLRRGLSVQE